MAAAKKKIAKREMAAEKAEPLERRGITKKTEPSARREAAKKAEPARKHGKGLALVTGATGHVGPALVRALLEEGYSVRGLVLAREKEGEGKLPKGVEAVVGDITKPGTLKGCCKDVDVVFHLAALVSYTASAGVLQSVNGRGTANLVKEALEAGVKRFVYASSISVYGKVDRGRALRESDVPVPTDNYGASKLLGENAVKYGNLPFVALRLGMVYGPGFEDGYVPLLKMLQRRSMPYVGSARNYIPFVHVDDVVRAFLLAAEKDGAVGGTYNVVGMPVTQEEALKIACKYLGVPAPRLHANPGILMFTLKFMNRVQVLLRMAPKLIPAYLEAVVVDRRFDTDKAQMELGWEPRVDIENGIAEMARWYKERRQKA